MEPMSTADHYLRDALAHLIAQAREAHADRQAIHTQQGDQIGAFEAGRALAYYEVVSYLFGQLDAFQLPRTRYFVDPAFDPDQLI
jgi:hypothetical protein